MHSRISGYKKSQTTDRCVACIAKHPNCVLKCIHVDKRDYNEARNRVSHIHEVPYNDVEAQNEIEVEENNETEA